MQWYNKEHRHSGLNFLTPNQKHDRSSDQVFEQPIKINEDAKRLHHERWSEKFEIGR